MITWAFIIGALSLLLEWKQNMLKAKTTRKVYDNAGNEWDVHGWYLTQHGWNIGNQSRLTNTVALCVTFKGWRASLELSTFSTSPSM